MQITKDVLTKAQWFDLVNALFSLQVDLQGQHSAELEKRDAKIAELEKQVAAHSAAAPIEVN